MLIRLCFGRVVGCPLASIFGYLYICIFVDLLTILILEMQLGLVDVLYLHLDI